jgi:hypothetical protein
LAIALINGIDDPAANLKDKSYNLFDEKGQEMRCKAGSANAPFTGREVFTLSANDAALSIAKIWRAVRQWKVHFEEYRVPDEQIQKVAPAFRHLDDVSTPALSKLIP